MAAGEIALVLGAGPGIGMSVAKKLASNGYVVAVASRSGTNAKTADGFLSLRADFARHDSVPALFARVKTDLQASPSVVVYNAAVHTLPVDKSSIFSTPAEVVVSDMNVNTITPYVAAQQAKSGWETLPKESKKTFIYTGNILNTAVVPSPNMMTLGMGKSASAYWVGLADQLHSGQGCRFFYTDERYEDGALKGGAIDGEAHAEFYAQLVEHPVNVPWHATFVKGKGYTEFAQVEKN